MDPVTDQLIFPLEESLKYSYRLHFEDAIVMLGSGELLGHEPADLHVCQVAPCPYTAPIPDADASQITQMGSLTVVSIGRKMGVLQAKCFILSIHIWCMGLQWNGCPFFCIAAKGPVYADTSGIKCARYCTRPRNHCTSCLFLGVRHSRTRAILSESAWMLRSSMMWPRQSIRLE